MELGEGGFRALEISTYGSIFPFYGWKTRKMELGGLLLPLVGGMLEYLFHFLWIPSISSVVFQGLSLERPAEADFFVPRISLHSSSLPEFMNFKLFGRTILVVQKKFGLFWGHPLSQ